MRVITGLCLCLMAIGCGKSPPPVTEVEGLVLLDEVPLGQAQILFSPELSNFGGEMNSSAVTDDQGRFRLTCSQKKQPGAVVGTHRVAVLEGPTPREFRKGTAEAQEGYANYLSSLKNRPIPKQYSSVGKTPLRVTVTLNQTQYVIKLTRSEE